MYIILLIMLISACFVLILCGYFISIIRLKFGKSIFLFIPIVIAIFMINIVIALVELSHTPNWS
ncbi:hypothetical protein [Cytobacillus praedii]|uniref:hypothetical protein n=1 Tax=Cytobacillus praedii TaxID=1742358 RepID=UPI002E217595|nr:hypothetical protein [Cytobacillus praedii]